MNFTPKINEALRLASRLHRDQVRKDKEHTPYISHLVAVAMILSEATDDEEIIMAGLLHDALEDAPNYTYENLVADCGARVAEIVKHVTEPLDANKAEEDQLPWLFRKESYLNNLRSGGKESAMVSASDKLHNTDSLIFGITHEQEEFLSRFHSSLRNKLWFHQQVLLIIEEKLSKDNILVSKLSLSTRELEKLVISYEAR